MGTATAKCTREARAAWRWPSWDPFTGRVWSVHWREASALGREGCSGRRRLGAFLESSKFEEQYQRARGLGFHGKARAVQGEERGQGESSRVSGECLEEGGIRGQR